MKGCCWKGPIPGIEIEEQPDEPDLRDGGGRVGTHSAVQNLFTGQGGLYSAINQRECVVVMCRDLVTVVSQVSWKWFNGDQEFFHCQPPDLAAQR